MTWYCRTWSQTVDGWTSTFDRFETEQEATEHGEASVKYRPGEVLAVEYEVFMDALRVTNEHGVTVDYDAAVELMDDDLREEVAAELSPCSEQEFFNEYAKRHEERFGEVWEPAKPDPTM